MSSSCPTESQLAALLAGDLPEVTCAAIEGHLSHCAGCREQLDRLASGGTTWSRVDISEAGETSSPEMRDAINQIKAGGGPDRPASKAGVTAGSGRYKLLQRIGEGGMGEVWMADQTEPVRRRVALKIIKAGMDTREVVARFETERQALAMMDHPSIAKVLDAGATENGRPFFVMELVKGIPITNYCDERRLGTPERLQLFSDLCSAINHAHQKGIIHRDIKPSNVLVTLLGEKAVPKVIDFGIAKAIEGKLTDKTLFTRFEQFIGTPAYMSPEQVAMSGLDVDTRADIYALGVLLYELLTGKPPFDAKTLAAAGHEEMRRIIREVEPPKPSSRLSTVAGADRTTIAKARNVEPAKVSRLVEPDMDWIIMKAIEKDRTRRYGTVNDLAQDIRRFLANEPVSATPPGAGYRLRKFMRRNKAPLSVAAGIASVLIAATIVSVWQAVRATDAEKLSRERLDAITAEQSAKEAALKDAEAISEFLGEVLQSADPDVDGSKVTVIEALGKSVALLETELTEQPARRAKLQGIIGRTYLGLGFLGNAIPLLEKGRDFFEKVFGFDYAPTLDLATDLACAYHQAGRRRESLELWERLLPSRRKVSGASDGATLNVMKNLAICYDQDGRMEESRRLMDEYSQLLPAPEAGPKKVAKLSPETIRKLSMRPDFLRADRERARFYADTDRPEMSVKIVEGVLERSRASLGEEHVETLAAMKDLTDYYHRAGRSDEAIAIAERAVAITTKSRSPGHLDTIDAMNDLGIALRAAGKDAEAVKLREQVLELCRLHLGPEVPATLGSMTNLAVSYGEVGRADEAIKLQEDTLTIMRRVLPEDHKYRLIALDNLAELYESAGKTEKATGVRAEWSAAKSKSDGQLGVLEKLRMKDATGEEEVGPNPAVERDRPQDAATPADARPLTPGTLVAPVSRWKWLHPAGGKDPAESVPEFHTSFYLPGFDDSKWSSGHDSDDPDKGFGYGPGFAGVDIGRPENMAHRRSAYFRTEFTTDQPHTGLELRCRRDDGIIVYLDGKEIIRDNVAEGSDAYLLAAKVTVDDEETVHRFPVPGTLPPGRHTLAISVHNTAQASADLRIGCVTLADAETGTSQK